MNMIRYGNDGALSIARIEVSLDGSVLFSVAKKSRAYGQVEGVARLKRNAQATLHPEKPGTRYFSLSLRS